ncbi:hypothetical protein Pcinc_042267, partial [Petrolisthes cinctipes]
LLRLIPLLYLPHPTQVLNFPDEVISAGLTNFSPVLVGTVIRPSSQSSSMPALRPCVALSPRHVSLQIPAYTLPFNVATSITFLCMRAAGYALPAPEAATASNDTSLLQEEEQVEWDRVLMGTLLSVGQVWAVESTACSVLILVGAFLCSPILALACFLGAQ